MAMAIGPNVVDDCEGITEEDYWRDQEGPRGTYGCACVSREARTCLIVRYGYRESMTGSDERCECLCHQWDDDE